MPDGSCTKDPGATFDVSKSRGNEKRADPAFPALVCDPPSNLLYDQERIEKYRPGGYHPVHLGDKVKKGRYEVVHKLGWGGFSTVWLARDIVLDQWVALKITTADSTNTSCELAILTSLQRDGAAFTPQVLDSFTHTGPNGVHQCIVMELLGPPLDAIISDYRIVGDRLDPEIILRISRQLLQGVAHTHEAGYGHGDISGANLAFTAKNLAHLSEEQLFEIIGRPQTANPARADGEPLPSSLPKQLVQRAGWDDWIDEDEEDIRLLDWGEAFKQGAEPAKLAQPGNLRAPETIFTGQFDHRIDLWRVGCTIYSLVFLTRPFQYFGDQAMLIAQMIDFVEKLPKEWESKWNDIQESLEDKLSTDEDSTECKLSQRFQESVEEPELKHLFHVIQGLMRFLPSERLSAADAIKLL